MQCKDATWSGSPKRGEIVGKKCVCVCVCVSVSRCGGAASLTEPYSVQLGCAPAAGKVALFDKNDSTLPAARGRESRGFPSGSPRLTSPFASGKVESAFPCRDPLPRTRTFVALPAPRRGARAPLVPLPQPRPCAACCVSTRIRFAAYLPPGLPQRPFSG